MKTTRPQMILIAVVVCLFAVGMAGFLNFFKYRANAERILQERLVVTGNSIENSIQSSLALGLQFADLGTLPGTMERERATDDLILSIEIFDAQGKTLYSTDRLRAGRNVPEDWLRAATKSQGREWAVRAGNESAAGIAIDNSFGLVLGYMALRYSDEQVSKSINAVAREIAATTFAVFVASSLLASLGLMAVMHRISRDFDDVENALKSADSSRMSERVRRGPFGRALRRFFDRVREAEAEIAILRGRLHKGS